jgi:hypothetical protein
MTWRQGPDSRPLAAKIISQNKKKEQQAAERRIRSEKARKIRKGNKEDMGKEGRTGMDIRKT